MANAERNDRIGGLERARVAPVESGTRYHIGIDLAWADESRRKANESGIVMFDPAGDVAAADWTIGIDETMAWLDGHAPADALLSVDAPLVVNNEAGTAPLREGGGSALRALEGLGQLDQLQVPPPRRSGTPWQSCSTRLDVPRRDGRSARGPGRFVSECYPYRTIVGAYELGYDDERPRYKRKPRRMSMAEFRPLRNAECDEFIRRMALLRDADPPMDLLTHPETRRLVVERSLERPNDCKHREDLLDAALCAWTAALWTRWGRIAVSDPRTRRDSHQSPAGDHHRASTAGAASSGPAGMIEASSTSLPCALCSIRSLTPTPIEAAPDCSASCSPSRAGRRSERAQQLSTASWRMRESGTPMASPDSRPNFRFRRPAHRLERAFKMTDRSLSLDQLPVIVADLGENGGRIGFRTIPDARSGSNRKLRRGGTSEETSGHSQCGVKCLTGNWRYHRR